MIVCRELFLGGFVYANKKPVIPDGVNRLGIPFLIIMTCDGNPKKNIYCRMKTTDF